MEYFKEGWKAKRFESDELNINTDSIRALELQEMQEEEKYIQALRSQREKIEVFRNEVLKKDQKIKELEKSLKQFKYSPQKVIEIEAEAKQLNLELQEKERENSELRQKVRKQVEEYENSLKEVQMIVFKEREEKNLEIKILRKKVIEVEEANKWKIVAKQLEEQLELETKVSKDRERNIVDNGKAWKSLEKMLKDQVSELSAEKYTMEETLQRLSEENKKLLSKVDSELIKEHKALKVLNEDLQVDLESTQQELNKAVEIIKRQENSMIELRNKHQESFVIMEELQEENIQIKKELQNLKKKYFDKEDELEKAKNHVETLENQYFSLEKNMKTMIDKENCDKNERQKHAKMKIELLNQRAAEVNKLAEVIHSFTVQTKYSLEDS